MATLREVTETLNNLTVTTLDKRVEGLTNQIFQRWVLWRKLKDLGNLKSADGGKMITLDVEYAENPTVRAIGRGDSMPGVDYEFMTQAQYDWKFIAASALRFYTDVKKNRGKEAIYNLVTKTLNNLTNSVTSRIERDLFLDGTADDSKTILGLQTIVADDPTAATDSCGGYSGYTNTWWRNQYQNMSGKSVSTQLREYLNRVYNNCTLLDQGDNSFPNFFLCDQATSETYDNETFEMVAVTNSRTGDLGMSKLDFKGQPIYWSPRCPANRFYILNLFFLFFYYMDSGALEFTDWKPYNDTLDWIIHGVFNGAFCTNNRAAHGVLYNINNPTL